MTMFPLLLRRVPIVFGILALMAAEASIVSAQQTIRVGDEYRLRLGDEIQVTIGPRSNISARATVLADGKVNLLQAGVYLADDKTIGELAREIADALRGTIGEDRVQIVLQNYRLRPGDHLALQVSPQREYDSEAIILPDGTVSLRGIDVFRAEDRTVAQLQSEVQQKLERLLVEPRASLTLLRLAPSPPRRPQRRPTFSVAGAVGNGGIIDLEDRLQIRRALILAGGVLRDADLANIHVYHRRTPEDLLKLQVLKQPLPEDRTLEYTVVNLSNDTAFAAAAGGQGMIWNVAEYPEHVRILENLGIQDGDAVFVPYRQQMVTGRARPGSGGAGVTYASADSVRVSGFVKTPGRFPWVDDMRIEDAIMAGGFLSPLCDPRKVAVYRPVPVAPKDPKGEPAWVLKQHATIDLEEEMRKRPEEKFRLSGGDEVYVPRLVDGVMVIGGITNATFRALEPLKADEMPNYLRPGTKERELFDTEKARLRKKNKKLLDTYFVNGFVLDRKAPEEVRKALLPPGAGERFPEGFVFNHQNPEHMQWIRHWPTIREFFLTQIPELSSENKDLPGTINRQLVDLGAVEVIRNGSLLHKVNLLDVIRHAERSDNLVLQPGDIVYLPPRRAPRKDALYYLREMPYLGFLFGGGGLF